MAFSVIQANSSLQLVNSAGEVSTLTLPSGITLRTDIAPRWAIFDNLVVLVNTPNAPLTIDAAGTVRLLTPQTPGSGPVVSAGSAGGLSGTYGHVRYTYVVKDTSGRTISESDYSPASNTVTITSQNLQAASLGISPDSISSRRLYRPTTGGTTLFPWLDVEGNVVTTVQDDLADAGLSLVAAPDLGRPPRLTLIQEWRGRLWGVGDVAIDNLLYSRPDAMWAWPADNFIEVPGAGSDRFGLVALAPRRDALGVGRRDIIWQVVGEDPDNFRVVKLSENTGVESQETVATYRDTVFWLWKDGVYQWDSSGLTNVSDGKVSSWFNTNSYFNAALFSRAFAVFDPSTLRYRLYLAAAGSAQVDRWIEYDLTTKTWWGPHKTSAFTPTSAFILTDEDDGVQVVVGSKDAFLWEDQDISTDGTSDGIAFDVDTKFFDGDTPEREKVWGQLSMMGRTQPSGRLLITPKTGFLSSSKLPPLTYTMSSGRERLRRIGRGKLLQLNLTHSRAGEPVELYGIKVPFSDGGERNG